MQYAEFVFPSFALGLIGVALIAAFAGLELKKAKARFADAEADAARRKEARP